VRGLRVVAFGGFRQQSEIMDTEKALVPVTVVRVFVVWIVVVGCVGTKLAEGGRTGRRVVALHRGSMEADCSM